MIGAIRELWQYRYLFRMLVARELKIRYKNSALGFMWSVVPLILDVIIYTFLIRNVFQFHAGNYSAYLLCGLIPWLFIQNAVLDSCQSILMYIGIIRKVYMPREVIPLAVLAGNFIHFALNWAVYLVLFAGILPFVGHRGIPVIPSMLWFPVITLEALVLSAGLSLWVSALNVFYEDVKFIVMSGFRLLMFMLPVIYPAENIRDTGLMLAHPWLFRVYMLNPITAIIEAYRKLMLQPFKQSDFHLKHPPMAMDWTNFAGSIAITVIVFVAGYAYFNSRKWRFVERM